MRRFFIREIFQYSDVVIKWLGLSGNLRVVQVHDGELDIRLILDFP